MSLLNFAIGAAYRAGNLLLNYQNSVKSFEKNESNDIGSIVTEADLKSEQLIEKMIAEAYPDHNFCGEEKGLVDNGSEYTWYIDPLDGTYNYVRNYPMWGVSIGVAKNQRPVAGAIYFPVLNKIVYAEEGGGAYANERSVRVSDKPYEKGCYSVPVYQYQNLVQANLLLMDKMYATKIHNCTSFDLACMAEGQTEVILSGTLAPWDSCAGVCIVREAGGFVTDEKGREWIMSSDYFVAANKYHDSLFDIINEKEVTFLDRSHLIPEINRNMTESRSVTKLKH